MNFRQLDFIARLEALIAPVSPAPVRAAPEAAAPAAPRARKARVVLPDLHDKARALLREIGCGKLAQVVQVRWHARLRTTAGQAFHAQSLVRLNPRLLQFGPEEVDKMLRHELAHLVARARAGRGRIEPHGPEWRAACRELGLENEARCHNLPLPRTRQRIRHLYRCPECRRDYPRVRPFRRRVACLDCCRAHAGGHYDERYRLRKVKMPA